MPLLPVLQAGVAAGGQRLADAGRSPAQADVAVLADGVGELGEPAVLSGDQERRRGGGLDGRVPGQLADPCGEEAAAVVVLAEQTALGRPVSRRHRSAADVPVPALLSVGRAARPRGAPPWPPPPHLVPPVWVEVTLVGGQGVGQPSPLPQLLLELLAPSGAGQLQLLQGDSVGGELGGDRPAQVLVVVIDAQLGGVARVVPDGHGCDWRGRWRSSRSAMWPGGDRGDHVR